MMDSQDCNCAGDIRSGHTSFGTGPVSLRRVLPWLPWRWPLLHSVVMAFHVWKVMRGDMRAVWDTEDGPPPACESGACEDYGDYDPTGTALVAALGTLGETLAARLDAVAAEVRALGSGQARDAGEPDKELL